MIPSLVRLLIVTGIILIPKVLGVCPTPDGKYTKWTMHFGSPPATIYDVLKGNDETAEAFVKFAAAQKDLVGKVDEGLYESCVGKNRVTYEKKFLDETSVLIAKKHADDDSGNSTFEIRRKVPLLFSDDTENESLELHICVTGNASNTYVVAFGEIIIDNEIDVQERNVDGEIKIVHVVGMTRFMCYQKEVNEVMILLRVFISSSQSRSEEAPKSVSDPHKDSQIDFPPHEGSKKDDIHQEDTKKDSGAQEDLTNSRATQSTEVDSHGQDQDQHTSSHSTPWILGLCIVVGVFVAAAAVLLAFYQRRNSGTNPFERLRYFVDSELLLRE